MKRSLLAQDLMANPVFRLTSRAPVRDAAVFLLKHGISGAPVEDEHGRWIGTLSLKDIVRAVASGWGGRETPRTLEAREPVVGDPLPRVDGVGSLEVRDLMSSERVFVFPETPLGEVVQALLFYNVDRLFVIGERGEELRGVITSTDVLRSFEAQPKRSLPTGELRQLL